MSLRDLLIKVTQESNLKRLEFLTITDVQSHPFIQFEGQMPTRILFKNIDISIEDADALRMYEEEDLVFDEETSIVVVSSVSEDIIEALIEIGTNVYFMDVKADVVKFIGSTNTSHEEAFKRANQII